MKGSFPGCPWLTQTVPSKPLVIRGDTWLKVNIIVVLLSPLASFSSIKRLLTLSSFSKSLSPFFGFQLTLFCTYACLPHICNTCGSEKRRASDPRKLELQMLGSLHVDAGN